MPSKTDHQHLISSCPASSKSRYTNTPKGGQSDMDYLWPHQRLLEVLSNPVLVVGHQPTPGCEDAYPHPQRRRWTRPPIIRPRFESISNHVGVLERAPRAIVEAPHRLEEAML